MRSSFLFLGIAFFLPGALGCAAMDKPWGKGAVAGAVVTATAAGISGGVAANQEAFGDADAATRGAAIGIGIVGGAAVGAVLGHLLFDEEPKVEAVAAVTPPPPAPAPAPLQVLRGATFAFNSAALTAGAEAELGATLQTLQTEPTLHVRIDGHTDSVGSAAYNVRLSERRAGAVKTYLLGHGIAPDRIEVRGLGSADPVASNATPEGRAENRRVELHRVQ